MTVDARWLKILALLLSCAAAHGQGESQTVIGPSNPDLHDGANALLAGDAERGIELTLKGLEFAANNHERVAAMSNLCAGHAMLEQYETALDWCNRSLEINERHWRSYTNRALVYLKLGRYDEAAADLDTVESINAKARNLKLLRSMLLDATEPVEPTIEIDDRRNRPPAGD